jgi:glutamate synthase (NADPH/NADH) small chain
MESSKPPKKKLDLNRREMPKQPHDIRRHNFDEVALGYSAETAIAEATRCLQCPSANCVNRCPVEIDIPAFVEHIAQGNFGEGERILEEKNCLPAICGRVCPQEEQCEGSCSLVKKGGQIAIGRLERFLADWEAPRGQADSDERTDGNRDVEHSMDNDRRQKAAALGA